MSFTVGGTDVAKVYLGATPVNAVYLGDEKVWPATPSGPVWRFYQRRDADTDARDMPGVISWYQSDNQIEVNALALDGSTYDLEAIMTRDGELRLRDPATGTTYTYPISTHGHITTQGRNFYYAIHRDGPHSQRPFTFVNDQHLEITNAV